MKQKRIIKAKNVPQKKEEPLNFMHDHDHLIKMLVVGDSGVGKSCTVLRWADDTYTEQQISTIGVDFKIRKLDMNGKKIKTQVWDTAGQERFRQITQTIGSRGADIAILVFDLTDRKSFENIRAWYEKLERSSREDQPFILVANKADLVSERQVSEEEINNLMRELPRLETCIESSAKTGENVEEVFVTASRIVLNKIDKKNEIKIEEAPSIEQKLIDKLNSYTNRVEKDGFNCFKFPFFKDSRTINRKANYALALQLKEKLKKIVNGESNDSLFDIFNNKQIKNTRIWAASKQNLEHQPGYHEGIYSSELNKIIKLAQKSQEFKDAISLNNKLLNK